MTESVTQHYQWTKPEVTKSASTWGGFLNTDLDSIDALVFANQQGIVPVGSITMFGGATAPANWLICDGRSLSTAAPYDKLFAVLQYAHGGSGANFNLPNLSGRFPLGGSLGASGGEATHTLAAGEMPVHAHGVNDPTHAHGAYQNAHAHAIATGSHSHGITTGSHSHGIPLNLVSGAGSGLTSGGASFSLAGGQNTSVAGNLGGNTDTAGNLGGNTDTQQPGVGIYGAATGVTIQNNGGGAAHNNMPPYVGLNFIIRAS